MDAQGSVRLAIDVNRTVAWEYRYQPYGAPWAITTTIANDRRQMGELDIDSLGTTYLHARWYIRNIGRFISRDPIQLAPTRVNMLNLYTYGWNSPRTFMDPSGMCSETGNWLIDGFLSFAATPFKIYEWFKHATPEQRNAMIWAFLGAVAVGIVIGLSCVFAGCIAAPILAPALAAFVGTFAAMLIYGTLTLHGTGQVDWAGMGIAATLGGIGGGIGGGLGVGVGEAVGLGSDVVDAMPEDAVAVEGVPEDPPMEPNTLRFGHDSADPEFQTGGTPRQMADELVSGRLKPGDLKPVVTRTLKGKTYVLDGNRRLIGFKMAAKEMEGLQINTVPEYGKYLRYELSTPPEVDGEWIWVRGPGPWSKFP